jgi:hypothetical protein
LKKYSLKGIVAQERKRRASGNWIFFPASEKILRDDIDNPV